MNSRRVCLSAMLTCVCMSWMVFAQTQAPPSARTVNVVDHAFGLTLPDPYRWMEGKNNAEFQAWLQAQGGYTRSRLDAMPTMGLWRDRMRAAANDYQFNNHPVLAAGRLFYLRREGNSRGKLMVREPDGSQRLLVDAADIKDGKGAAGITTFMPSPDGKRIAVNIDHEGNEISRIQLLDVDHVTWLPDVVEPVWGEFSALWLPDGTGFTYTQLAPPAEQVKGDPMQNMHARLHRLGAPSVQDMVLAERGRNDGLRLASNEFPVIDVQEDSSWALAEIGGARQEQRLCYAPRAGVVRGATHWHCVVDYADNVQGAALHKNTLYVMSMQNHPNGRLLAMDLSAPEISLAQAREVIPEASGSVLTNIQAACDALYAKHMTDGIDSFDRVDYKTGVLTASTTPFAGSAWEFSTDPRGDGFVTTLEGWVRSPAIFLYKPGQSRFQDTGLTAISPLDFSDVVAVETEAVSKDGTRVPLTILHRRDVVLDRENRSILEGYGGYGVSLQPFFSPRRLEWAKEGGVYAIAHVRGGGEKGDAWHRAGQGANKGKSIDDVIACGETLVKLGYTTSDRTALYGQSFGGILAGNALTQSPQSFGAAVIDVGMLNPVRLLEQQNGANQIGETGDPRTAEGLHILAAMDAYQHIRDGVNYPSVLLMVGLNDSRVEPWETGKFAARLRAASRSGKPVWIRLDDNAGHGAGSEAAAASLSTDMYAFLDTQLPGRIAIAKSH
ncbi:prolyl oligopeptidase family serine peptidase [Dyella nitratireducens]|uniref:prolyl oligopeptidase n=1 Tax=Dyella nitratireducens TaxID=1849580 RepID=A0ABQ1FV58_9GAMM|nr:prolyl oligopeptidase family serine peptidase [Dyella nitratireducens]GGA29873.1 prolyl oligopeptidase [Dyella nitratireducens]GLQ43084.1 prolyl oligopeptidase [Dyella nitratireducens]